MTNGQSEGTLSQAFLKKVQENPFVQFVDWTFRGIGQVVFQGNPWSGLVILIGLTYSAWSFGLAALLGSIIATGAALLIKADRSLVEPGLFGFNGVLTAIGINLYTGVPLDPTSSTAWGIFVFILFGAAFSAVVMAALTSFLGHIQIPALTMPFVLTTWAFVGGTNFSENVGKLEGMGPLAAPLTSDLQEPSLWFWLIGIGKGIGEIFLQDSAIAGYLILLGIAINSWISALMALLAAVLSIATAIAAGFSMEQINLGLFTFNAALTAMALGGVFLVLTVRGFLYAVVGIIIATWMFATIAGILGPLQLPAYTAPFVLTTWAMLMAKDFFAGLIPVPPPEVTKAEDHLHKYLTEKHTA